MSSVMQAANECKDDAKQAMSNATMQCQCDVMQHPFLRSISPLIAVAENKLPRVSDSDVYMSVGLQFWKNSQRLFDMICIFMYMNT